MANLIYLCGREGAADRYSDADVATVARRITPDNAPDSVSIERDDGIVQCLVGNADAVPTDGTSVCCGQVLGRDTEWPSPGTPPPDGSYAIVRDDADTVELVSDVVGSRTLYYRLFEDLLVCGTSQRAVLHFADEFEPAESAIAWMISSGTLGPGGTWDATIEQVPQDGVVTLDRTSWELDVQTNPVSFAPIDRSTAVLRDELDRAIEASCEGFQIDCRDWVLPLSGGVDSRALLSRFGDRDGLEAVTWGTADALEDPRSDASVARELAAASNVSHTYHELPMEPDDVETVFERFLSAGEGRIDHVSGYVDGFDTFASLAEDGVQGIIRGDVPQSSTAVKSSTHVRFNCGARLVSDYDRLSSLAVPGNAEQRWPRRYHRRDGESLVTWRDRAYQLYRIPTILAALTDLKVPYVEVINPLLTREMVEAIRRLPDEARAEKRLFTDLALDRGPDVPVAERGATPDYAALMGNHAVAAFLRDAIDTQDARRVLGAELVDWTLQAMRERTDADSGSAPAGTNWPSITDAIKFGVANRLPASLIDLVATHTPVDPPAVSIDPNHLAFRLYIVSAMHRRLRRDVTLFSS